MSLPLTPELCRLLQDVAPGELPSPEAEALALRDLIAATALPSPIVVRLWRDLLGERRRLAGAPPVGFAPADRPAAAIRCARDHAGATAPLAPFAQAEAALAHTRETGAPSVILLQAREPWWVRLLAEPSLRVIARTGPGPDALVIGQGRTGPTGHDETYFVTDAALAAPRLIESLGLAGFAAEVMREDGALKLVALAGYVQDEDERIRSAPGRLKGVIGSSPIF